MQMFEHIMFTPEKTFMPVTMQQFEDLTNEILVAVNKVTAPNALDADYMAQILMSALHHYDHKIGIVNKHDLFESCINRISCHVTYHAVNEIQARLKAKHDVEKTGNVSDLSLQLVDGETSPDPTH